MNDKSKKVEFRDLSHEELATYPTVYREGLLDGQVVLVSGGGTGIGIAIAALCARLGAKVAVCSRKEENLENAATLLERIGNPYFTHAPRPFARGTVPVRKRPDHEAADAVRQIRGCLLGRRARQLRADVRLGFHGTGQGLDRLGDLLHRRPMAGL